MVNFKNVSKIYKENIVALDDVSLYVDDGEFCFVVGPSGAGKSTLVRLLIKQEKPTEGEIEFGDIKLNELPRDLIPVYRQQLGIVFQDLKLLDSKSVRENVNFALEIIDTPENEIAETTDYLLETVGLQDRGDLFPEALSGGERQRAAIARALANDPKILIADEPTGNLDPETSYGILDILNAINDSGTNVFVITHDKAIVDEKQTRVIHMDKGKIVQDGIGGYNLE